MSETVTVGLVESPPNSRLSKTASTEHYRIRLSTSRISGKCECPVASDRAGILRKVHAFRVFGWYNIFHRHAEYIVLHTPEMPPLSPLLLGWQFRQAMRRRQQAYLKQKLSNVVSVLKTSSFRKHFEFSLCSPNNYA